MRRAVALLVAIPARARLLPQTAGLDDGVRDRQSPIVGVGRLAALARVVGDVEARHVVDLEGTDGIAEVLHDLVDLLRQRAFLDHQALFEVEGDAAAIGDEAVAIAGVGAHLVDVAPELHGRRQRRRRRLGGIDDLEQLHDVGRHEVVRAGDLLGALRDARDFVDVERAGIGEQQAPPAS